MPERAGEPMNEGGGVAASRVPTITDPQDLYSLSGRLFIAEHEGETWAGSVYWMVRGESFTPPASVGGLGFTLSKATPDVELRPDPAYPPTIEHHGDRCRAYLRPDGEPVIINDGWLRIIEALIAEDDDEGNEFVPDYVLKQSSTSPSGPSCGPVSVVSATGERLAVVMPRRP